MRLIPIVLVSAFILKASAQNCLPPIGDIGQKEFKGYSGGLYPDGKNIRPAGHKEKGLKLAREISPLNQDGIKDPKGQLVFLSIGMSNTSMEFSIFKKIADTASNISPNLTLVNGSFGGYDINRILDPGTDYWDKVERRLSDAGLSNKQVQIVWFKEAEAGLKDTLFPEYPLRIKEMFKQAVIKLSQSFPNLKLIYLASRTYGGYATVNLNPEPIAYYSVWSVKWLIEDQINGDQELAYDEVPWLSWGPYLWANGSEKRKDGFSWEREDFVERDGTHPSESGCRKVAQLLYDYFSTDEVSRIWFTRDNNP
ncbi:hypothetical protein ACFLU5_00170 [Bacteroidota bacterium]